jgi:hypothetical protein
MIWQWPAFPIHAATTRRGVAKPLARFSPTADHRKPVALTRAAGPLPWPKSSAATIESAQRWAALSSRLDSRRRWRPSAARSALIKHTTAARNAGLGRRCADTSAFRQPRRGLAPAGALTDAPNTSTPITAATTAADSLGARAIRARTGFVGTPCTMSWTGRSLPRASATRAHTASGYEAGARAS